jgi:hypothetical protein
MPDTLSMRLLAESDINDNYYCKILCPFVWIWVAVSNAAEDIVMLRGSVWLDGYYTKCLLRVASLAGSVYAWIQ